MENHAVIRIEIDCAKKIVTDVKISKHLNPLVSAIILNQVACQVLAPLKLEKVSQIITPKLRIVPEGARKT